MTELQIIIQTLEDAGPERKESWAPGYQDRQIGTLTDMKVGILEDMTATHGCAVQFIGHDPEGKPVTFMLTQGVMDMFTGAYLGARERFKALQEERGFSPQYRPNEN